MRKGFVFLALLLAGCAGTDTLLLDSPGKDARKENFPTIRTVSCEGPARVNCKFINSPVKLSKKAWRFPGEPYPYFRTRNDLKFVNAANDVYVAPKDTWTDGASIPVIFVPIIGDPRSREFMNAATVHDAYSSKRNENGPYYHTATWQEVHRMFYDGLLASGTPPLKAKIMYAAVYLGGPRWSEVRKPPRRQAMRVTGTEIVPASNVIQDTGLRKLQSNVSLAAQVPEDELVATFQRVKTYIENNNPSIDELEAHLTRVELDITGAGVRQPARQRKNFRARPAPKELSSDFLGNDGDSGLGQGDIGGAAGSDGASSGGGGGSGSSGGSSGGSGGSGGGASGGSGGSSGGDASSGSSGSSGGGDTGGGADSGSGASGGQDNAGAGEDGANADSGGADNGSVQ